MNATRPVLLLLAALLLGCPPQLRNDPPPVDDDDDATADDDDDDAGVDDPCCDATGNGNTWDSCDNREAIECVCDNDDWCCGSGWDDSCSDLYRSPCGAECPP